MKQYDFSQITLRVLSTITETLILFWYYIAATPVLHLKYSDEILFYLLGVSIIANTLCCIEFSDKWEGVIKGYIPVIGIGVSAVASFLIYPNLDLIKILITFMLFYYHWLRIVKNAFKENYEIYSFKQFAFHMQVMFILSIFHFILRSNQEVFLAINRIGILYVILSLLLLTKVKHQKYRNVSGKSDKIDLVFTLGFVLFVFLISPLVLMGLGVSLQGVLYGTVYILSLIIPGIMKFFYYIYQIIMRRQMNRVWDNSVLVEMADDIKKPDDIAELVKLPSYIGLVEKILGMLLLLAIVVIFVVIVTRYMASVMGRGKKKDVENGFSENREFVLDITKVKDKVIDYLGGIKDNIVDRFDQLTFQMRASIKEKIRYEYAQFLKVLWERKLIEGCEEYTAQRVMDHLCAKVPSVQEDMRKITYLYQEIRYGVKEPDSEELKQFKEKIKKVVSQIG